jgi:lauroyl/myristoyl acyltransferase
MILLSGHTTYYFMILWALHLLGHKTAFMMVDPRSSVRDNAIMQDSVIRSADALSAVMPVLFTNEGGTVKKASELLKKGYSLLMLADIPGYHDRGQKVSMFQEEFWVPAGVLKIREEAAVPAAFVFSYATKIDQPYQVAVSSIIPYPEPLDLQKWAAELEATVRRSPESWFGWFILKDMI